MAITPHTTSEVLVSHLDNPGNFYVQFANSHAQLQIISEQINQHYSSLSEMELNKITPTSIVIGEYHYQQGLHSVLRTQNRTLCHDS